MRYCSKCILPETRPNLIISEDGVCNACKSSNKKCDVDWGGREQAFRKVVERAKAHSSGYDCLIPVSGGKDSTWQVIKCLEYGLNPLAVTWRTPARTPIGQRNLDNMIRLGVDHIDYTINPKVEARFMLEAYDRFGATAIPMHMALFNIPLNIAVKFKIPLVVLGENAAAEYGQSSDEHVGFALNDEWIRTYGVMHGTTARDWVSEDLTEKQMTPYFGPDDAVLEKAGVHAIFLGHYFPWDPRETARVAAEHGFMASEEGVKTGLYDFADIDCDFISIHHWMKWYKFGFTRLFDNLSIEIRSGRISRDEAIRTVVSIGDQTPWEDIDKFCRFVGIDLERFLAIAEKFRNHDIWQKDNGVWKIPGFLIEDWDWGAGR